MTEAGFLAEIAAHPEDSTVRLVYADWLDDNGDGRGELVRVEEEMRALPVHLDRYWELKPRRNELRARCDPAWLEALRYGTDYEPVFRAVPDDWRGRWRLIREFTERWHGIPMPDLGGRRDVVEAKERELGLVLPPSFQEYVAYVADVHAALPAVENPPFVAGLPSTSAITLMGWDETSYLAVEGEDLGLADPPVYIYAWARAGYFDVLQRDQEYAPRLSEGVLASLCEQPLRQEGSIRFRHEPAADPLAQLRAAIPDEAQFGQMILFEGTDWIVVCRDGAVLASLRTPALRAQLPGPVRDLLPF